MRLTAVPGAPTLHTTPRPDLRVARGLVRVDLDDADEQRLHLAFRPYQAVRATTADCFLAPRGLRALRQRLIEVVDSAWIKELRAAQEQIDSGATFMDQARHFLIPTHDVVIEVVAWAVTWEGAAGTATHPPAAESGQPGAPQD
jgi:hypothetical protein